MAQERNPQREPGPAPAQPPIGRNGARRPPRDVAILGLDDEPVQPLGLAAA